jgi:hypothetical protein
MRTNWPLLTLLGVVLTGALPLAARAQEAPSESAEAAQAEAAENSLTAEQRLVADRFRELEKLLLRMAELTAPTDPKRAALLRQAVAQSKQRDIDQQFQTLVELLKQERLAAVVKSQTEVHDDLRKLLELLLSEDRSKRIESEKERIRNYLKRVNKLIKDQKSVQGETARGADEKPLAEKQGELADKTGELAGDLKDEADASKAGKPQDDAGEDEPTPGKPDGQGDTEKPKEGEKKDGADKEAGESNDQPGDKKDSDKQDADKPADAGEKEAGDSDSKKGDQAEAKPSKPGDDVPPPQEGQPQSGEPQEGQSGKPGEPNPAQERIEQAQKRMQEAQKKLEEAQREDATEKQAEAIKELEQAKAELEEILRQLREEEMSRTLAALEARFRKMLAMQIDVQEGTQRIDKVPEAERDRDDEIEAGRLSRKEAQIVAEADKALIVLREEGSAVAFPEAVEEMRADMHEVTERLAQAKVGEMTQGLETDIIAALEEMIAALQKAQKEMEDKAKPGEPPPSGEGEEQPLVDTLAELRMIRALQMRVNLRTERYAKLSETEQVDQPEILAALKQLAEREQRIHKVTRDIVVGRNR